MGTKKIVLSIICFWCAVFAWMQTGVSAQAAPYFAEYWEEDVTCTNAVVKTKLTNNLYLTRAGMDFSEKEDMSDAINVTETANCTVQYITYDLRKWGFEPYPGKTYYFRFFIEYGGTTYRSDVRSVTMKGGEYVNSPALADGALYRIKNVGSGKYLEFAGGDGTDYLNVTQNSFHREDQMKWKAVYRGDGYSFINAATGKAMDILGRVPDAGGSLGQYKYFEGTNQHFKLLDQGSGQYVMFVSCSALALDTYGGGLTDGTAIIQQTMSGSNTQKWVFERVDVTPPGITNVTVTDVDNTGYTVVCNVSDDVGVSYVEFPTWTQYNGQDDLQSPWPRGEKASDGTYRFRVNTSAHNNEGGNYTTHIYAYDAEGNYGKEGVVQYVDTTAPIISDIRIDQIDNTGYTVACDVTDDVGVSYLQFCSWTKEEQDDLVEKTVTVPAGSTYYCRVPISEHLYDGGWYETDVYAYDATGNRSKDAIAVYVDTFAPDITNVQITEVDSTGYTISCEVTDGTGVGRVEFHTYAENGGETVIYRGEWKNGNTYSARVEKAKHGYRNGVYHTMVKVWDVLENGTSTGEYTVTPPAPLTDFTLSASKCTLILGKTKTLKVSDYQPADTTDSLTASWSSSNPGVATVSANGKITAKSFGSAVISCTVAGVTKTCEVTVKLEIPVMGTLTAKMNGVQITWNAVPGAVKYMVYRKTGEGSFKKIAAVDSCEYVDTTAVEGTTYCYSIRCAAADGKTAQSDYDKTGLSIQYVKPVVKVEQPVLSKVSNTEKGVLVTWKPVAGAVRYKIYYRIGEESWKTGGYSYEPNYEVKGLTPGTKYSFTVRCVSEDGKTSASSYDPVGKSITYYLPTPVITNITGSASGVTVKWNLVGGAELYKILYRVAGESSWKTGAYETDNMGVVKNLVSGTNYEFSLRCMKADKSVYTSDYDRNGVKILYLEAPSVTKLSNTASGIKVQWNDVPGAVRYKVMYRDDPKASWKSGGYSSTNYYTVKGLTEGKTYFFTVRCVSEDGKTNLSGYSSAGKSLERYWDTDFTVTYVLDGGKNAAANPASYKVGDDTIILADASKTGYRFQGWYAEETFEHQITQIKKGSTANHTLYAKWAVNTYIIAFDGNGAESGEVKPLTGRVYDKTYTLRTNTFARTGYEFVGWNTKADGSGTAYADKAAVKKLTSKHGATVTLYAQWKVMKYQISYLLYGGENSANNPAEYSVTTRTILLESATRKGFKFCGWYKDGTTAITKIAKGTTGDIVLQANWEPIRYSIAFDGNGAKDGNMGTWSGLWYNGIYKMRSCDYTKTGYTFVGWNTRADGSGKTYAEGQEFKQGLTATDGATVTLYAQWKKK